MLYTIANSPLFINTLRRIGLGVMWIWDENGIETAYISRNVRGWRIRLY